MYVKDNKEMFTALRMIRIVKDMSAKELAELFGVSTSYLYAIETGERYMEKTRFEGCLDKLGIDIARYEELEKRIFKLSKLNLPYEDMNMACLAAAIKTVNPKLESSANSVIYAIKKKNESRETEKGRQIIKTK